jgi:hypothetical protein
MGDEDQELIHHEDTKIRKEKSRNLITAKTPRAPRKEP